MDWVKIRLRQVVDHEYHVTLDYREAQEGVLPAIPPELPEAFGHWRSSYRDLERVRSCISAPPQAQAAQEEVPSQSAPSQPEPSQPESYRLSVKHVQRHSPGHQHVETIKQYLNQWLDTSDPRWKSIRESMIALTSHPEQQDAVLPLFLDASTLQLGRLPWQEWNLFDQYSRQPEIALRVKGHPGQTIRPVKPRSRVRILIVVGRSDGIQTQADLDIVQRLEARGADVVTLLQPSPHELSDALWDAEGYHIFVFTGHSGSQPDGQIGWIELSQTCSLSINEFKHAFEAAVDRGLQLALFNSCDGLGLAHQLALLNLPRSIVMAEPVPDDVAVTFLQCFFDAFSQGKTLAQSLHQARRQLEHFNIPQTGGPFYPGVMWLPTLCTRQSALEQPLSWQSMIVDEAKPSGRRWQWVAGLLGAALASAGAIALVRPAAIQPPPPGSAPATAPIADPALLSRRGGDSFEDVDVPQGRWRYGGSTTWAPIRKVVDSAIEQTFPEFDLIYTQHPVQFNGSGTGIEMLLNDQISFAQSSRPLNNTEYETAEQRSLQLKQTPVAIDAIAIAVNPELDVDGLSIEEIQGIYDGSITDWQQVGGPDLPVVPYSREPQAGGTPKFFANNLLNEQGTFGSAVQFVGSTTEGLRRVAAAPGGVYYASAPEVVGQCTVKPLPIRGNASQTFVPPYAGELATPDACLTQPNQVNSDAFQQNYPLTRRLFVITKQNGQSDETAGEAYIALLLSAQGQALIQQAGFIPLR
ncbi:MAG: substrate-binding domain-containing protein [Elainellaceae cyanobacterium]